MIALLKVPALVFLLLLFSINSYCYRLPDFRVTGKITDQKTGEPLQGVNIVVKGTTTGTTSNGEGSFAITVPNENATLIVSYQGFENQEIAVNGRASITIALVAGTRVLEEVIVTGYGTESKKSLTSSIASIKPKDLENQPVARLDNMLQGRAAGVQIVQNSGAPGTNGTTIRIRGISSVRAGSDPLLIVDGIPLNGFIEDINPADVEAIDVLKDAAASAIYGARAANGVILITTKRGKGKPRTTVNISRGIQNIAREYEMLNGFEHWEVMKEMYTNTNRPFDAFFNEIRQTGDTASTTDWPGLLLQNNAPITDINVALRGGEGRVKYAASFNYFDQKGILISSGFKRMTARLNLDIEVSKRIRFGNSLSLSNTQPRAVNTAGNGVYMNALVKNPLTQPYDSLGRYTFFEPAGNTGNPLANLYEERRDASNNRVFGSVFGEVTIIKDLTFRSTWGIDYRQGRNSSFTPSTANQQGRTSGGFDLSEAFQWINTNTINYTKQITPDHNLAVLAVFEQQEFTNRGFSGDASNFPGDIVSTLNGGATIVGVNSNQSSYGLQSLAGRITYSFRDKYILSGNLRRDGSSRFGKNNRYGTFPSVSVAWNISDEGFLRDVEYLSYLKLRGSAGQVGNQGGLSNFGNRGLYTTGADYVGSPGTVPGAVPNSNLKWETTTQYNAGLEMGFLNERITFIAEAYNKRTDDLLLDRQLAQSSGAGTITINLGKIENKGLEFGLNTRNLTGAFKWSTNVNVSFNRNKVLSLYGNANDQIFVFAQQRVYGVDALESTIQVGYPLGGVYGYISDGVYARSEDNKNNLTFNGYKFAGGDVIYRDIDGDGKLTPTDRTNIGNMQPRHVGGINNSFSYKGVSLDVFMNWSYGNDIFNATRMSLITMESPSRNSSAEVRNRWRRPGDITNIPRAATGLTGGANSLESTLFIEDGSYLRVNNITLGYQFPNNITQRLRLNNLKVYMTGNNVFIFTKYKGIDPDVRSFNGEGQYGIDFGAYPRARIFTFGLSLDI